MNNLHRELAPVSAAAWTDLEDETRRSFSRHVAGRRVVDVVEPGGEQLAAVGTGHLVPLESPAPGVTAQARAAQPVIELRVPFTVSRQAIDDVERGAADADWQPAKDAAKQIGFAEDRIVFDGWSAAGITGIRPASDNATIALPTDVLAYPVAVSQALSALRLAGVNGPYALALSADAYTAVTETSDHGYPIHEHLARVVDEIIWAPAIDGAVVLTTRGGDYALHLGQDLSIGYLAHDGQSVQLYLQETLTFVVQTSEAAVGLTG
jgi:uncharacterized linocin/CFP29 family protein